MHTVRRQLLATRGESETVCVAVVRKTSSGILIGDELLLVVKERSMMNCNWSPVRSIFGLLARNG